MCLVPIFEGQEVKTKGTFHRVHLCVKPPNVEEDCSSLKGHSLLGARHSRERIIPERKVIHIATRFGLTTQSGDHCSYQVGRIVSRQSKAGCNTGRAEPSRSDPWLESS